MKILVLGVVFAGAASVAMPARAAEGDGIYGRTDGDASFVVGVDGGAASGRKLVGGDLRLRYLETAGIAFGYEEYQALEKSSSEGELRHAFRTGVELRPFFPARFLKNREFGNQFFDLLIDSFGLDVGAVWNAREGRSMRAGLYAGVAIEVPLIGQANGPWLRVATSFRWSASKLEGDVDPNGRVFALTVGLAWHQFFGAHLVDRKDRHVL